MPAKILFIVICLQYHSKVLSVRDFGAFLELFMISNFQVRGSGGGSFCHNFSRVTQISTGIPVNTSYS